jgi:peptidoglycan/LPS O-acetylase OafA/YrhL
LIALIAFSVCCRLDISTVAGMKMFLAHALLLHNLSPSFFFGINSSFWSLGTEMQLYLLYPALLYFRQRWGMVWCLGIIFVVSMTWRLIAITLWGLPEHLIDPAFCSPLVTWFDWALGAYVAEQAVNEKHTFTRHAVWLRLLVPAFVFSTVFKPLTTCSFSLAAIVSAVVLDRIARAELSKFFMLKFLAAAGLVSYSVYLWHQPLLDMLPRWLDPHSYVIPRLVTVAMICIVATISYACFESPGVKAGKMLWKKFQARHN